MKNKKRTKNGLRLLIMPLLVFMLVFSSAIPSMALAADGAGTIDVGIKTMVGTDTKIITEEKIKSLPTNTMEVVLTLTGNTWASGLSTASSLSPVLLNGMSTNYNPGMLKTLFTPTTIISGGGTSVLTIKIPSVSTYKIEENQTVTMNISPALIENWTGQVTPVTFTIYAKPQISVGGSILNATPSDLQKGGKSIELNLKNAKWNEQTVRTITGWNSILAALEVTPGFESDLSKKLKSIDPNNVVFFENENRTLKINLPAFPGGLDRELVTLDALKLVNTNVGFVVNNGIIFDEVETEKIGEALTGVSGQLAFNIEATPPVPGITNLTIDSTLDEEGVILGGKQIKLSLTNNLWNDTLTTDVGKLALINGLSTNNQTEEWNKIKEILRSNLASINRVSGTEVTIVIPAVANYFLTENQNISLKIPYQLLQSASVIPTQSFMILADQKILVSGSATPSISQTDLAKGGKKIVLKLVNTTWKYNIVSDTTLRQELLSKFNWSAIGSTQIPDITTDIIRNINVNADVKLLDNKTLEIELPAILGVKLSSVVPVEFTPHVSNWSNDSINVKPVPVTKVTQVNNQSATVSGSILTNTNDFDIVKGDKEIVITLKNDVWVKDIASDVGKSNLLMGGFTLKDFKGNPSVKKDGLPYQQLMGTVVRTSDTVVTIKLPHSSAALNNQGFSLKADANVELRIDGSLLNLSTSGIDDIAAFKIAAVAVELPKKEDLILEKADIKNGGKTVTITLKNATFKSGLTYAQLVGGVLADPTSSLWTDIATELLKDEKNIKVTKDKMTIKLPPLPNYNSTAKATIALKISSFLIDHTEASQVKVDGAIIIGAVATATLNGGSFSDTTIKSGGGTFTITLNDAEWDPTIPSNNSKKAVFIKGFTVTDQTKEWSLLSKEISSSATFTLSNFNKTLMIKLSAVPAYSIIRNQVVDITLPKSILVNYNFDIPLTQKLAITVPGTTAGEKTLSELNAAELTDAIANNKRIIVPSKKIQTIGVNTIELPSPNKEKPSITTIEVTATNASDEVSFTVAGQSLETVSKVGNKTIAIYKDLPKNTDLKVSIFGTDKSKPLQADIYKKIGKGSKTYNEIPKNDYTGSYLIFDILTNKSLLKEILKYYTLDELKVGV